MLLIQACFLLTHPELCKAFPEQKQQSSILHEQQLASPQFLLCIMNFNRNTHKPQSFSTKASRRARFIQGERCYWFFDAVAVNGSGG